MTLYRYRAVDPEGNPVEGTMEEESARRVVSALEQRDLTVNQVEEATPKTGISFRKDRLTWKDLEEFNDNMVAITRGGLPLAPSLAMMSKDLRNARLTRVMDDIRRHVEAGNSLDDALQRHPKSFSPIYTTLVRAGERAGNLPAVFQCLSGYSKNMVELKLQLQAVLAYPIMLVVTAFLIVTFLMVKVVPVFAEIFNDFGGNLPVPTQLLVNISAVIIGHPYVVGVCVGLVLLVPGTLAATVWRPDSSGYALNWLALHVPLLGRLHRMASVSRFSRSLGMLLQAGVPMLEGMDLAGAAAGNAVLRHAVTNAAGRVAGGATLADALRETGFFEHGYCWLLGNGEQRGEVDRTLLILEEDYQHTIERIRLWIMAVIEPAVIVCLGLTIGFIVISMYLPIFSLGSLV